MASFRTTPQPPPRPYRCRVLLSAILLTGCQSAPPLSATQATPGAADAAGMTSDPDEAQTGTDVRLAAFQTESPDFSARNSEAAELQNKGLRVADTRSDLIAIETQSPEITSSELAELEALAASQNPKLTRLQREASAASARTRYVDKLPDPTFGANVFGHPIETAAGSQRANLTWMQMIPWLSRLDAQQQQACFEALAMRQQYAAERLRVIGDIRAQYYRLYVLQRNVETVTANQELLVSLIEIITGRVATGSASQGDVLLGTLELSRLEEQLITLRQQVVSTEAEINRLVNRPAETPVIVPNQLSASLPAWTHDLLVQTANARQPVIAAAELQVHAARWGVDVAELRRRPDLQVGAAWFFMDDNRPASSVVDVGRDAWSVGATVSIPLNDTKYDAIRDEALWKYTASRSGVEDVRREFDARLLDLLEQARAASDTAALYQDTIIPQAEQTLRADQESLTDGAVEFDRVIQDFRSLLTLEFGYHRAVGQLATSIARIQQAVGIDLPMKFTANAAGDEPAAVEDESIAPLEFDPLN